ncbi:MAG: hypothetical protein J5925_02550 [Clostridia bacterium]|nr:hypothetical protein [Clostridia bacterium]
MKSARSVALAGVFTALCVTLLFIGSAVSVLDLGSAAITSFVILIALTELGGVRALAVYAASAVLALVLLPNKEPAVYFAAFAGFYPVLKVPLNRIKPKWLSVLARFAVFDLCAAGAVAALYFWLKIPLETGWYAVLLILAANLAFAVYDLALERAVLFYNLKLRNHIFGKRR